MTLQRKELWSVYALFDLLHIYNIISSFFSFYIIFPSHQSCNKSFFSQEVGVDLKTDSESQVHKTRNLFVW